MQDLSVTMVESSVSLCQQLLLKPQPTPTLILANFSAQSMPSFALKHKNNTQIQIKMQIQIQQTPLLENIFIVSMLSSALTNIECACNLSSLKKITGLFRNFSQRADPTPFENPLTTKNRQFS